MSRRSRSAQNELVAASRARSVRACVRSKWFFSSAIVLPHLLVLNSETSFPNLAVAETVLVRPPSIGFPRNVLGQFDVLLRVHLGHVGPLVSQGNLSGFDALLATDFCRPTLP